MGRCFYGEEEILLAIATMQPIEKNIFVVTASIMPPATKPRYISPVWIPTANPKPRPIISPRTNPPPVDSRMVLNAFPRIKALILSRSGCMGQSFLIRPSEYVLLEEDERFENFNPDKNVQTAHLIKGF